MWSRNEDNSFDWSIIGYNSKVVSPRNEITEEDIEAIADEFAIGFAKWIYDFKGNINKVEELLEIYKKEKYGN